MAYLGDKAIERLRGADEAPDFSATRYELVRFLARGGMGAVYLAEDRVLGRQVAIKILDAVDSDGTLAKRLDREARILAKLEHPGIVPVHDAGSLPDGRAFYVMKFVQGARLDQFLGGLSSLAERLRLFLRICETVSFAHSRGILHRDLKPSNVMVGAFGEVLLMDWGLAKLFAETAAPARAAGRALAPQVPDATSDGMVLGTPGYMSPEQTDGRVSALDERSDIFSLGRLLEFLVVPRAAPGAPRPPRPLEAICRKATEPDPAARYGKVGELAADVSAFLDNAPVSAHRETIFDRALRFYHRYQVAILLIAMYLFMRTLFVLYGRRPV
ncbi:MAG TPA: serine/threonine-protein kinase [Candidatus Acidoferrum sp.]|nr:serine/threonine-protein kinase [Candidatus Acidoferrum sp.]